jgi:OmpA-OmpF porin, OOP family
MKLALLTVAALSAASLLAQSPSADPGDPPHLKRYSGAVVFSHSKETYTPYRIPLSKWAYKAGAQSEDSYEKMMDVEGSLTRIAYYIPDLQRTVIEVQRNYLDELPQAGWEILFQGKGSAQLHGNFGYRTRIREAVPKSQILEYPHPEETAFVAARRTDADGDTYATFIITKYENGLVGPFEGIIKRDMVLVRADVIKPRALENRMVFVNATQMQSDITATGHASIYGILFDFNKADLKPESQPTLAEIGKLMAANPGLKLLVVGHTDNVGTLDFNRDLSARRAQSVVQALSTQYGVAPQRLHGEGVSFLCPVSTNDTEDGRAKNRRVELVKW